MKELESLDKIGGLLSLGEGSEVLVCDEDMALQRDTERT